MTTKTRTTQAQRDARNTRRRDQRAAKRIEADKARGTKLMRRPYESGEAFIERVKAVDTVLTNVRRVNPEQAQRISDAVRKFDADFYARGKPTFDASCKYDPFAEANRTDADLECPSPDDSRNTLGDGEYYMPGYRVEGYTSLEDVLYRAYLQAATGKGSERHGRGLSFDVQPTQVISNLLDSDVGLAFQAIKKINEGMRLDKAAKIKEMLGAINYIASLVIYTELHQ